MHSSLHFSEAPAAGRLHRGRALFFAFVAMTFAGFLLSAHHAVITATASESAVPAVVDGGANTVATPSADDRKPNDPQPK